jgi:hypothetical protein
MNGKTTEYYLTKKVLKWQCNQEGAKQKKADLIFQGVIYKK